MITLATSTQKLQILLAGAVSTTECPVTADYDETSLTTGHKTPKTALAISTGNTAVDVISAPAAGIRRHVTGFSLYNADTAAVTATVRVNDNSTTRQVIVCILQTLETLLYNESQGWYAVDVNGNRKTNAPASSGASSTADSRGASSGTQASTADSKALSVSTLTSTADSKAVSDSVIISTNLSTFTTASGVTSSTESLRTSAGNSTTLSKTKSSFSF